MPNEIKCPKCGNPIDVENVIATDLEQKLQEKYRVQQQHWADRMEAERNKLLEDQKKFVETKNRENEIFQQKILQEKQKMEADVQAQVRKSVAQDYEVQLRMLEQANKDNEERLRISRQKEVEFLQKELLLKNKEAELELSVQQKLQDERTKLAEELKRLEEQRSQARETEYQLRLREMEKQLDDQKRLAEEMKRRAEQGSTQLQGEVQELELEEMLRNSFPFDEIIEVGKGIRGADCIQTVRNQFGQDCGKIIFESKRRKDFSNEWIEKLKADMRSQGADVAVLVTQVSPKDMLNMGEKNGVWICSFAEVKSLVHVLRDGIIKIANAVKSQQNKGDKVHMLYDYLTSQEFSSQWKAVRDGFMSMKLSIQRERDSMEKLWKSREKQLEKVLLNAAHIHGSIEGIAGQHTIDFNIEEEVNGDNLLDG